MAASANYAVRRRVAEKLYNCQNHLSGLEIKNELKISGKGVYPILSDFNSRGYTDVISVYRKRNGNNKPIKKYRMKDEVRSWLGYGIERNIDVFNFL